MTYASMIDYYVIINKLILGFEDSDFVQDTCKNLFGKFKKLSCMVKSNFCNMCCNYHIGMKFETERNLCKDKCGRMVKGVDENGKPIKSKKNEDKHDRTNKSKRRGRN